MASSPRDESQHLKRLDALRPAYERLKAERIRAEGDVERLERDLEAARRQAREELGTDDENEIRRLADEALAQNAALIDDFAARLQAIETQLAELGTQG